MPDNDFDPHGYFDLPDSSKQGHCPKCGAELQDTGQRITRPDGQVRKLVECTIWSGDLSWHLESPHYEGTVPA